MGKASLLCICCGPRGAKACGWEGRDFGSSHLRQRRSGSVESNLPRKPRLEQSGLLSVNAIPVDVIPPQM